MVPRTKPKHGAERPYPRLDGDRVIYVIGDIHGRSDLLRSVHAAIDADSVGRADPPVEIYLGDYVDRGLDSKGVIDLLIDRILDHEHQRRMIFLGGNHEEAFLAFLTGRLEPEQWKRIGGYETAFSYGIDVRALQGASKARWVEAVAQSVPATHRLFLEALRDSYACDGYFFAHAGIRPGVGLDDQDAADLRWIRDAFLGDRRDHGAIVVHGHTPVMEPAFETNRINLDTGAYLTNRLTCLAIDAAGPRLL